MWHDGGFYDPAYPFVRGPWMLPLRLLEPVEAPGPMAGWPSDVALYVTSNPVAFVRFPTDWLYWRGGFNTYAELAAWLSGSGSNTFWWPGGPAGSIKLHTRRTRVTTYETDKKLTLKLVGVRDVIPGAPSFKVVPTPQTTTVTTDTELPAGRYEINWWSGHFIGTAQGDIRRLQVSIRNPAGALVLATAPKSGDGGRAFDWPGGKIRWTTTLDPSLVSQFGGWRWYKLSPLPGDLPPSNPPPPTGGTGPGLPPTPPGEEVPGGPAPTPPGQPTNPDDPPPPSTQPIPSPPRAPEYRDGRWHSFLRVYAGEELFDQNTQARVAAGRGVVAFQVPPGNYRLLWKKNQFKYGGGWDNGGGGNSNGGWWEMGVVDPANGILAPEGTPQGDRIEGVKQNYQGEPRNPALSWHNPTPPLEVMSTVNVPQNVDENGQPLLSHRTIGWKRIVAWNSKRTDFTGDRDIEVVLESFTGPIPPPNDVPGQPLTGDNNGDGDNTDPEDDADGDGIPNGQDGVPDNPNYGDPTTQPGYDPDGPDGPMPPTTQPGEPPPGYNPPDGTPPYPYPPSTQPWPNPGVPSTRPGDGGDGDPSTQPTTNPTGLNPLGLDRDDDVPAINEVRDVLKDALYLGATTQPGPNGESVAMILNDIRTLLGGEPATQPTTQPTTQPGPTTQPTTQPTTFPTTQPVYATTQSAGGGDAPTWSSGGYGNEFSFTIGTSQIPGAVSQSFTPFASSPVGSVPDITLTADPSKITGPWRNYIKAAVVGFATLAALWMVFALGFRRQ